MTHPWNPNPIAHNKFVQALTFPEKTRPKHQNSASLSTQVDRSKQNEQNKQIICCQNPIFRKILQITHSIQKV
ncbi:unnamed protein product [Musa textilis]